jgi:hypothetical protein
MTNFSGAELQVEDAEQDICHRRKHRKKIGILSSEAGQKMSRRNKAVQRPAKPAEAAAKVPWQKKKAIAVFCHPKKRERRGLPPAVWAGSAESALGDLPVKVVRRPSARSSFSLPGSLRFQIVHMRQNAN